MTIQSPIRSSRSPVVVVGAGIAGLTAAALLGRAGVPTVVLEKSSAAGGRATTRDRGGFLFNLGPHALYRAGILKQTLGALDITVSGGIPTGNGGFAILDGCRHTLPAGLVSLITTGLLRLGGKLELARFQVRLPRVDTSTIQNQPLSSWLESNLNDPIVREMVRMLVRVTSFTNDPDHQSAGAAIEQLQLGLKAGVLYVDGGWQTIVDGLRRAAIDGGARVISGAHAVSLERSTARTIDGIRLADGTLIRASGIVVTGAPLDVDRLAGTSFSSELSPPVRVATLDVALRSLPNPRATVAFGVDAPLYYSVHSAIAQLAPEGGALIHVSKYLPPNEQAGASVRHELGSLMEMMQPGWRAEVVHEQFIPSLTVTHTQLTAARAGTRGRPASRLEAFDNVCIAGDWVGPHGQLSDAVAASAADAVTHLQAWLKANATNERCVDPAFLVPPVLLAHEFTS
jgi:phytoene dehydrogenase-like protein